MNLDWTTQYVSTKDRCTDNIQRSLEILTSCFFSAIFFVIFWAYHIYWWINVTIKTVNNCTVPFLKKYRVYFCGSIYSRFSFKVFKDVLGNYTQCWIPLVYVSKQTFISKRLGKWSRRIESESENFMPPIGNLHVLQMTIVSM